jgi:hypothetical protein
MPPSKNGSPIGTDNYHRTGIKGATLPRRGYQVTNEIFDTKSKKEKGQKRVQLKKQITAPASPEIKISDRQSRGNVKISLVYNLVNLSSCSGNVKMKCTVRREKKAKDIKQGGVRPSQVNKAQDKPRLV